MVLTQKRRDKKKYPYPESVVCEHSWEEAHIVDVELFAERSKKMDNENEKENNGVNEPINLDDIFDEMT
jgi:hypothetical protein